MARVEGKLFRLAFNFSPYLTSGQRNPCREGRDLKVMDSADNQMYHYYFFVVIRAGSQTPGGLKSEMSSYSFPP